MLRLSVPRVPAPPDFFLRDRERGSRSAVAPSAAAARRHRMVLFASCLTRPVAPDAASNGPHNYVGLTNPTRTTCHLNAVLQALYMTPEFRDGFLDIPLVELPAPGRAVMQIFQQLTNGGQAVSTKALTAALRPTYTCNRQQDCHDTWLVLCDQLEAALKGTAHAKLMNKLFEGKQLDYVRCHTCGTVTQTKDTFSNLSIAVPNGVLVSDEDEEEAEKEEAEARAAAAPAPEPGGSSAEEVFTVAKGLAELFTPEQMRGDDQYVCDKCTGKHDAERGVRLQSMPPILIIHLKRFAVQLVKTPRTRRITSSSLVKLNTAVRFEMSLDMRSYVEPLEMATRADAAASDGTHAAAAASGGNVPAKNEPPRVHVHSAESSAPAMASSGAQTSSAGAAASAPAAEEETRPSTLLYDLYAVLLHAGTLEKGHYFALIRDMPSDSWSLFDDDRVRKLSEDQLKREMRRAYGGAGSVSAYMLLYRERPLPEGEAPAARPVTPPPKRRPKSGAASPLSPRATLSGIVMSPASRPSSGC